MSGSYLFGFGTGPSGALAVASLIVTLKQTEWLNGINTLTISSGQLLQRMPHGDQSDHKHRPTPRMEWRARKVGAVDKYDGRTKYSQDDRQ
jgi:hypothetical protein